MNNENHFILLEFILKKLSSAKINYLKKISSEVLNCNRFVMFIYPVSMLQVLWEPVLINRQCIFT